MKTTVQKRIDQLNLGAAERMGLVNCHSDADIDDYLTRLERQKEDQARRLADMSYRMQMAEER